jgi:NodT family efflux transporter outer membrane factor (OMF) lipoprotein
MKLAKILAILAITACFSGCAVGPDYHTPANTMPGNFTPGLASTNPPATILSETKPIDLAHWWQSLNDPELNSLVEHAIQANPDLEIALDRLQEARADEAVTLGGALPKAEMSGGAGVGTGTNSTKNRVSGPLNAATNSTGLKEITEVAGFDAGWELDFFGKNRREIEAVYDDARAAAADRNAVLISLVSDVVRAYMDARTLQLRLAITNENIQTEQQTFDFVQGRFNRGITNGLDVSIVQRQLETVKAQVAPLQAAMVAAQRRVAVLLGKYPEDLTAELQKDPVTLPQLPGSLQPGLPVDLLERRPDIRVAEWQLAASTARIGVATADLFPRVGVTAGIGFQGQGLNREPDKTQSIWSAGPTAYWPLLDFGTLDAAIEAQDFHTQALLANYKKTILSAVEEVDNAITNYTADQDRLNHLSQALKASEEAVNLATQRYDQGLTDTDFLYVVDAQRQLYDIQDQYTTAQESVVLQFVALYKGLGGGWESYQSVPQIRTPQPAILASIEHVVSADKPQK